MPMVSSRIVAEIYRLFLRLAGTMNFLLVR